LNFPFRHPHWDDVSFSINSQHIKRFDRYFSSLSIYYHTHMTMKIVRINLMHHLIFAWLLINMKNIHKCEIWHTSLFHSWILFHVFKIKRWMFCQPSPIPFISCNIRWTNYSMNDWTFDSTCLVAQCCFFIQCCLVVYVYNHVIFLAYMPCKQIVPTKW
jgi:hypothetical protein